VATRSITERALAREKRIRVVEAIQLSKYGEDSELWFVLSQFNKQAADSSIYKVVQAVKGLTNKE
jgi:hypothetical protein